MKLLRYYLGSPVGLMVIGFFLVVTGVVIPFMIILDLLPSTFFLNFLSYAASVAGLLLGVVGSAQYVAVKRRKDDDDTDYRR